MDKLARFITERDLLKVSKLAKKAGIDAGNLSKNLKMGKIPKEHEEKLLPILKLYDGDDTLDSKIFFSPAKDSYDGKKLDVSYDEPSQWAKPKETPKKAPKIKVSNFTGNKNTNIAIDTTKKEMPKGLNLDQQIAWIEQNK